MPFHFFHNRSYKKKTIVNQSMISSEQMDEEINSFENVKFNVGGSIYEVSRSLLDQFPNTMIARAASTMWNKKTRSKDKPIFIDRNGDRFAYVLDYMRDNIDSIFIAVNVPLHDFHTQTKSMKNMYNKKIDEMEKFVKAQLDAAEEQVKDVRKEIAVMKFARDCYCNVLQNQSTKVYNRPPDSLKLNDPNDKALFEKHLNMFGLSMPGSHSCNSAIVFDYYTLK